MKIELCSEGYREIDAIILEIEHLATDGVFSLNDAPKICQQIILKTKNLRQFLYKAVSFVPEKPVISNGEGSAA